MSTRSDSEKLYPFITPNSIMAYCHFILKPDDVDAKARFIEKYNISELENRSLEKFVRFLAEGAKEPTTHLERLAVFLMGLIVPPEIVEKNDKALTLRGLELANEFHQIGTALTTLYALAMQAFMKDKTDGENTIDLEWFNQHSGLSLSYLVDYDRVVATPFIYFTIHVSQYLPDDEVFFRIGKDYGTPTMCFDDVWHEIGETK